MKPAEPGPQNEEDTHLDAVAELRRSEARYRNIFESAAVALWEINFTLAQRRIMEVLDGDLTKLAAYLARNPSFIREAMDLTVAEDVNGAGMRMLGASSKEELLGPVGKVWPRESETTFGILMVAAVERQPTFEIETQLKTLAGKNIDVLHSVNYPPEALSLESIFVAFSDVSARNRDQAALQKAQADLAHATRLTSLGELTASIAHEISQPLAGIISNGQAGSRWLRRAIPDVQSALNAMDAAVAEAKRVAAVISGIRALAKKQVPRHENLNLNLLIEETLLLLRRELDRNDIELDMDLSAEIAFVLADRVQVQQVLINLVMNATQALTQETVPERKLTVATEMGIDDITVSVSDSGPGIDPSVRSRLFTAFATTKPEGMGLGLSLCSSIVDRHGGRIWADLDDTRGATFRFSLPRCDVDSPSNA